MKLFCIFAAVLAFALAEESVEAEIGDSEAVASTELLTESKESLEASASAYSYVPSDNRYNNYVPPQNSYVPPQNNYVPPQNSYVPPQNTYVPPQNTYVPPQNNYVPPQNTYVPPQNTYVPPQNTYVPPQNNYVPPQNTYYPPANNNNNYPSNYYPSSTSTTTTPIPIIKNELIYGDNGGYKYEYEIADGTHVGEEGYATNPNTPDESIVKKGWYSYPGPDGKIYTVTYWADHTGFHATGDHLPTPPPVPAAIQASLDKIAKEEAERAEAEKNKPPVYYPQQTEKPVYYPNQPAYNPNQPTYNPNQPTYYPNQPTYYPNQPTAYPTQPAYNQQQNYPSYGK